MEAPQEDGVPQITAPTVEKKNGRLKGITERVKSAFSRKNSERAPTKEDLPPMQIDFRFNRHYYSEDAELSTKDLASYDIFIPEFSDWKDESLKTWRKISSGKAGERDIKKLTKELYFKEHGLTLVDKVKDSGVAIGFMEPPANSAARGDEFKLFVKELVAKVDAEKLGDFDLALKHFKSSMIHQLKGYSMRESYFLEHFPSTIREVIDNHPDLKKKSDLRILINLGTDHAPVVNDFKNAGYSVKRAYPHMPQFFGPRSEVGLRLRSGKEIPEELWSRGLLESHVGVFEFHAPSSKVEKFCSVVCSYFTVQDIKSFIESLKGKITVEERSKSAQALLGRKGIEIPKTEAELDLFLLAHEKKDKKSP